MSTSVTPRDAAHASSLLARRHAAFRAVVRAAGPCEIRAERRGTHFETLTSAIVHQQLNGTAAKTILGRVHEALSGVVTPEQVLATPEEVLRAAGLSGAKTASLRDLAQQVASGAVPLAGIGRRDDDAVIGLLTQVRGVGRWTAQMFLMFRLGRLDVWPTGDYGVRKGYAILHGFSDLPTERALEPLGDVYAGYRSVAAWYCWRAVDDGQLA